MTVAECVISKHATLGTSLAVQWFRLCTSTAGGMGFIPGKIMASGPITSWEIDGKQWKQCQTLFLGAPKSLQMVIAAMKLKDTYSLEGKL